MPSLAIAPFRFRDLPGEIRNRIYRQILCDFEPPPNTVNVANPLEFQRVGHSIDPTILRTSKQTYREAYDVMIKNNRFVRIESIRGLPLRLIINGLGVPVVNDKKSIVRKFEGHVLAVNLGSKKPVRAATDYDAISEACTLMILNRDLGRFCNALTDGDLHSSGFSENLQISITLAPLINDMRRSEYTPNLQNFFSGRI